MKNLRKQTKKKIWIGTCLLSIIAISTWFYFFNEKSEPDAQPLFSLAEIASNQPLDLKITTDLNLLFSKNNEEVFQIANCIFTNKEKVIHEGKMKVKKRGVTRKKICDLPPIMLKFGKGKNKVKLKMVVPCKEGGDFQQLIYKEYLAYQIYNQLTDYSFKAKMVKLEIEDSEGVHPSIQVNGFVIEEDKSTAERMEANLMPQHEKLKFIDQENYRLFTMFQYCIGNTDWNLNHRHNLKLICKKDSKTPIPVPYDFDYSGFVNAPYAIPHHTMPIDHVKERYFMWRGKNKDGFENVITLFKNKKQPIFDLINNFQFLDKDEKIEISNYLNEFYFQLEENEILASK